MFGFGNKEAAPDGANTDPSLRHVPAVDRDQVDELQRVRAEHAAATEQRAQDRRDTLKTTGEHGIVGPEDRYAGEEIPKAS